MNANQALILLEEFIKKSEEDGDQFFLLFISKELDSSFATASKKFDFGDALLVIQMLVQKFKIEPQVLLAAL